MSELDVTVIMASLPERVELRAEAIDSIARQTRPPAHVRYQVDVNRRGPVATFNAVAGSVETEWLFPFADDDLMDPEHFEALEGELTGRADIVYSWCRVTGRPEIPQDLYQVPLEPIERIRQANFIPGAAAIRTSLFRELGGYREPSNLIRHEDWDLWLRALNAGARFVCVPRVTWTYRVDPAWPHVSERQ